MTFGLGVALAAVVVAVAFGLYRQYADGRFRSRSAPPAAAPLPVVEEGRSPVSKPGHPTADLWSAVLAAIPDAQRGERATLLQFSSAFCAPCRATRRTLADVADVVPGVVHLEVDAEHHLELVRELGILRTPTTLVLDGTGHVVARAAGAPRKEQVLSALP
ncbi:thioredoxin family protein [Nocardioides lianchengensis]|uniref:Thiol-disulfide isomerase or thioredoxin n=1 Tax=Nocardioides lianchengensis TaxID=1045774 RepID=A0A1G6XMG8_9ACTN|nr:thioredoxin family protein [Nocardioides lianchengensis]NYG13362.1 thiol-disulfide isomerase/thioredoxin [Nocardioides lianchengensis]SDD79242.1 Thiol-disulfide isomerase or thioredoxin [Nocardioides lianchengensis]